MDVLAYFRHKVHPFGNGSNDWPQNPLNPLIFDELINRLLFKIYTMFGDFFSFLHWVAACRLEIKLCVCANMAQTLGFVINIIGYRCSYPKVCYYAAHWFMHNKWVLWVLQLVHRVPSFLAFFLDFFAVHVGQIHRHLSIIRDPPVWRWK